MSVSHIIDYILSHYLFIVLFPWVMNLPTILLSSFRFLSLSSLGPPLFCGQRLFVCYRFYGLCVIYHCVNRLRVACSFRVNRYAICILTPLLGSARWYVLRWAGLDMISVLSPQIRPILDRGGKRRSYAGVLRVSFYCPFVALGLLLRAHSRFCRLWFLAFIAASYSSFRSVRIFVLEWLLIILSIRGPFRLHLLIGVRIRVTLRRRLRCQDHLPFALLTHSLRHGSLACRLIVWTSVPYWAAVVAEPSCRALERLISLRAPILRITLFLVDVLLSILLTTRSFSLSPRNASSCVSCSVSTSSCLVSTNDAGRPSVQSLCAALSSMSHLFLVVVFVHVNFHEGKYPGLTSIASVERFA